MPPAISSGNPEYVAAKCKSVSHICKSFALFNSNVLLKVGFSPKSKDVALKGGEGDVSCVCSAPNVLVCGRQVNVYANLCSVVFTHMHYAQYAALALKILGKTGKLRRLGTGQGGVGEGEKCTFAISFSIVWSLDRRQIKMVPPLPHIAITLSCIFVLDGV